MGVITLVGGAPRVRGFLLVRTARVGGGTQLARVPPRHIPGGGTAATDSKPRAAAPGPSIPGLEARPATLSGSGGRPEKVPLPLQTARRADPIRRRVARPRPVSHAIDVQDREHACS